MGEWNSLPSKTNEEQSPEAFLINLTYKKTNLETKNLWMENNQLYSA